MKLPRSLLSAVLVALFAIALFQPAKVQAETNGFYLAPKFLMTFSNASMSGDGADYLGVGHYSSFTLGGAIAAGYDFYSQLGIPLRAEVEYAFRGMGSSDWDETVNFGSVDVNTNTEAKFTGSTLMANFYLDFHNSTGFTPYIGAGIGVAFNYVDVTLEASLNGQRGSYSYGENQTSLAWQVGAGVAYSFTENIAVDVAYRYLDLGYMDVGKYDVDADAHLYAHEILAGLRFTF